MRTQILRTAAIAGLALGAGIATGSTALAQSVTTDEPAGYLVFPRIVSDVNDIFGTGTATNTVIQLTNTNPTDSVTVHCFYINATGSCSSGVNDAGSIGAECRDQGDCVGAFATCDPQWTVADFTIELSPQQPTGWVADEGNSVAPPGDGAIPPVNADFFVGELRCIQVNDSDDATPVNANDLQGVATIYEVSSTSVDVRSYNATGIQAILADGTTQNNKQLCLGGADTVDGDCVADDPADGDDREYAACPAKLIVGHFFEGAAVGLNSTAATEITLSPCSADLVTLVPTELVVQFLVFNEFEQRMSASTRIECVETFALSDIGNIFDVSVQGTLAGSTHLRPVDSDGAGLGMIGLVEEAFTGAGKTATHPNNIGDAGVDVVEYVFP